MYLLCCIMLYLGSSSNLQVGWPILAFIFLQILLVSGIFLQRRWYGELWSSHQFLIVGDHQLFAVRLCLWVFFGLWIRPQLMETPSDNLFAGVLTVFELLPHGLLHFALEMERYLLKVEWNPSSSCWNDRFKVRNMHAELICLNPDDILLVSSDSFA